MLVKNLGLSVLCVLALLLSSCGSSHRILMEPGIKTVRSVAVVSVSSQAVLANSAGGGMLMSAISTQGLTGKASTQEAVKLQRIAVNAFEQELGKVPGWKVVPFDTATKAPGYSKMQASMMKLAKSYGSSLTASLDDLYSSPEGVVPTPAVGDKQDWKPVLANLAKELNVDAVMAVQLDLTYRPDSITGVSSTASAQMAVSVTAVDREGNYLANTRNLDVTRYRCKSKEPGKMMGRNLDSAEEADKIFQGPIRECMGKIAGDMVLDRTGK